jgi:hypothetical protein
MGDHAADRIGQRRHLLQPPGHGLDALGVQRKAVEERGRGALLRHYREIAGIRI